VAILPAAPESGLKGTCANRRAASPPEGDRLSGAGHRAAAGAVSDLPPPRWRPRGRPRWPLRVGPPDDHTDQRLLVYHPAGRGHESSGVTDGSDFLPYPEQGWIDHNEVVSVGLGRRLRTMADAAQMKGASRLRIQHSPQSEEERGVRSAPRSRLYEVGRKGFEGLMQVSRGSEGVPRRSREKSGVPWIRAVTPTASTASVPRTRPLPATLAAP
jgi:hypothetical protein